MFLKNREEISKKLYDDIKINLLTLKNIGEHLVGVTDTIARNIEINENYTPEQFREDVKILLPEDTTILELAYMLKKLDMESQKLL